MYKLVTNDSSAYALSILPFEGILDKKGMQIKVMCIAFGTEIDTLAKVKEICTDELKTSVLTVYEDSTMVRELKDYTVLEQITTATVTIDGKDVEVLMAKMSRSTTINEQITALEDQVKTLNDANRNLSDANISMNETIAELKMVNTTLSESVEMLTEQNRELIESLTVVNELRETVSSTEEEVAEIQARIADVNEDELDIDALKEYRIKMSKLNLATYLENNTVTSSAHGGVSAEYSMTSDKQSQLMAVIMMGTLNPEYQPSWNASGEVCSYDWTLDELQLLAADIEAVVRPLVTKQQTMEVEIRSAGSIEDVKAVNITF